MIKQSKYKYFKQEKIKLNIYYFKFYLMIGNMKLEVVNT